MELPLRLSRPRRGTLRLLFCNSVWLLPKHVDTSQATSKKHSPDGITPPGLVAEQDFCYALPAFAAGSRIKNRLFLLCERRANYPNT
jgi:hypothetical protein